MCTPRSTALLLAAVLIGAGCNKIAPPGMGAKDTPPPPPPKATIAPEPPAVAASPPATLPAGHPPIGSVSGQPDDPTVAEFVGLRGPKPESWAWFPPTSTMRAANYRVPAETGEAELVVFYFGQGMGGTVQANIDRWSGQFRAPDGGGVEPIVSETTVAGMPVTRVELAGNYQGMGAAADDQLFLAAIVEAPVGNTYIRLVGPRTTVDANRGAFEDLVAGLRKQ